MKKILLLLLLIPVMGTSAATNYFTIYNLLDPTTVDTNAIFDLPESVQVNGAPLTNSLERLEAQTNEWNTAYNWGDHASGGYLTSYTETDPLWLNWVATNTYVQTETDPIWIAASNSIGTRIVTLEAQSNEWNTAFGWGDHSAGGYLTAETDPLWIAASNSIGTRIVSLEAQTNEWNTAYNWGDHAAGGYLTSYTETDPLWIAASNSIGTRIVNIEAQSNEWNTAFGWGDHASGGYLTSYTETDPVWAANSNLYYLETEVDALPVSTFSNDSGYLTAYTETDPIWGAISNDYYTAAQVDALPVTDTNVMLLNASQTITGQPIMADDKNLYYGTDSDASIVWATGGTRLNIRSLDVTANDYINFANWDYANFDSIVRSDVDATNGTDLVNYRTTTNLIATLGGGGGGGITTNEIWIRGLNAFAYLHYNYYAARPANAGLTYSTIYFPQDASRFLDIDCIIYSDTAGTGSKNLQWDIDYAGMGENAVANNVTSTTNYYALTQYQFSAISITNVITGISAGDMAGVILNNQAGGRIRIHGWRIRYTTGE